MTEKEFQLRLEKSEKNLNELKQIRFNTTIGYFDLNSLEYETIRKYKLVDSLKDDDEKKKVKNALIEFWSSSIGNKSDVKRYKYLLDIVIDSFPKTLHDRINKAILNNEENYRINNLSSEEKAQSIMYNNLELKRFREKRERFEKHKESNQNQNIIGNLIDKLRENGDHLITFFQIIMFILIMWLLISVILEIFI